MVCLQGEREKRIVMAVEIETRIGGGGEKIRSRRRWYIRIMVMYGGVSRGVWNVNRQEIGERGKAG
jgi:hypothetical protein